MEDQQMTDSATGLTVQNEQRLHEGDWDVAAHPSSTDAPTGAAPRRALSLDRFAAALGDHASARMVFGEPVHADGVTVVPAARAFWGVGGGSGEGMPAARAAGDARAARPAAPGWGAGGGGGVVVAPVGYIVIRRGDAVFRPITSAGRLLLAASLGALLGAWMARR